MKILPQPIKVIDDFFEAPLLWNHFAIKQEYSRDENSTWPGTRTAPLNELNMSLFNSAASKIIRHIHDRSFFSFLKINFALTDGSYNKGWLHQDEPMYNVAGVIFLNPVAPVGSGLGFYNQIKETDFNYNQYFFEELKADPSKRIDFIKYKDEQRSLFKRNMYVENVFNRCVMFPPHMWHAAEGYFGTNNNDSRLTLTFFGVAK